MPLADGDKRCSCPGGQVHQSFGQCLREKAFQVTGPDHSHFVQRHRVLTRYANARAEGIQPQSPLSRHTEKAIRRSDKDGEAWRA